VPAAKDEYMVTRSKKLHSQAYIEQKKSKFMDHHRMSCTAESRFGMPTVGAAL
jgi:hypothetical protein